MPPGYTSLLFAHLYEDASCPLPTRLFAAFRGFLLASFGLGDQKGNGGGVLNLGSSSAQAGAAGAGETAGGSAAAGDAGGSGADGGATSGGSSTLAIRLISRRPGRAKRKMARQIGNEGELLAALRALGEAWSREGGASASVGGVAQPLSVSVSLLDFAGLTGEAPAATCLLRSGLGDHGRPGWPRPKPDPACSRQPCMACLPTSTCGHAHAFLP